MKRNILLLTVTLLSLSLFSQSQQSLKSPNLPIDGEIFGKVIDKDLNQAVEYANIAIYSTKDSSLITGGITNENGEFAIKKLPAGKFYMTIKFIGYNSNSRNNIMLTPKAIQFDAGTIELQQASVNLDGVEVVADRIAMQYKIDKKVISVSQYSTAASGTAVDILEKTPSVNVDIEGNVELRGSSSFTVLIDGRPSPFEGSDALEQIPASSIESIEIITNPSAKFDPEGTAGIINIITKKSKIEGISGLVNANIGLNEKYGSDFLINYRTEKFNIFGGAEYNHRKYAGDRSIDNSTLYNDTINYINSSGISDMIRESYNVRAGFDYFLSKQTTVSANVNYGYRERSRINDLQYIEYNDPNSYYEEYDSYSDGMGGGTYLSATSDFMHKFNTNGHELSGQINFRNSNSDNNNINELLQNSTIMSGQNALENSMDNSLRLKLDYVYPFSEKSKLEAGYQSTIESSEGSNIVETYDFNTQTYVNQTLFSHVTNSDKNIHAMYSTLSGEFKGFGYMVGLRSEYTDRSIALTDTDESFDLNRWDFFPSAHISYALPNENQFMASYTRRINRPRSFYLQPYETFSDAYNVRAGNPALNPEYIDSYEAGYTKKFGKSFISLEAFFRKTNNKIERTRSVYSGNIMYNTFENVGYDQSLGIEAMANINAYKWWNINVTGSTFSYKVEGELYGTEFSEESFNWNASLGNTFMLTKTTRLQLDGILVSPSITAQGRREGFYMANAAIRQDLLDRKLTVTLQVRDIFGTGVHEFYSSGPTFDSHINYTMEAPVVMLSLAYKINNYKSKRKTSESTNIEQDSGDIFSPK